MIRFIKGIFHPGLNGEVIVETASGMGFEIHIPAKPTGKYCLRQWMQINIRMLPIRYLYDFPKNSLNENSFLIIINRIYAVE